MTKLHYTPLLLPLWLLLQLLPDSAALRVLLWAKRHREYFAWISR